MPNPAETKCSAKHAIEIFREFPNLDWILKDGCRKGRSGVRAAVLRVLSSMSESGVNLTPAVVWRRLRQLRNGPTVPSLQRSLATPDDEALLRRGYSDNKCTKRQAIAKVLKRHPDWPRHQAWKLAKILGLSQIARGATARVKCRRWTDREVERLLNRAGCDPVKTIAVALQRSPAAVHSKLASLGHRGKVTDSYSRRWVADTLHIGFRAVDQLLKQNLLKMHNPNVTAVALRAFLEEHAENLELHIGESTLQEIAKSNGRHTHQKIAELLAVSEEQVRHWVLSGMLPPVDERITYASFESYCQKNISKLNHAFMDEEHRQWLAEMAGTTKNWDAPTARQETKGACKHATVVRSCPECGRRIRGNAYFRHLKLCTKLAAYSPKKPGSSGRAQAA